jgi:hypothetical protein
MPGRRSQNGSTQLTDGASHALARDGRTRNVAGIHLALPLDTAILEPQHPAPGDTKG